MSESSSFFYVYPVMNRCKGRHYFRHNQIFSKEKGFYSKLLLILTYTIKPDDESPGLIAKKLIYQIHSLTASFCVIRNNLIFYQKKLTYQTKQINLIT